VTATIAVFRGGEIIRRYRGVDILIAGLLIAALLSLLISGIYTLDPSVDTIFTSAEPTDKTSSLNITSFADKITLVVGANDSQLLDIETTRQKAGQYLGTNVTAEWTDVNMNVTYWNVMLTQYDVTPTRRAKETSLYAFLGLCLVACLVGVIRIRLPEEKQAFPAQT
jgi:Flp pilus assembly pilin Flp